MKKLLIALLFISNVAFSQPVYNFQLPRAFGSNPDEYGLYGDLDNSTFKYLWLAKRLDYLELPTDSLYFTGSPFSSAGILTIDGTGRVGRVTNNFLTGESQTLGGSNRTITLTGGGSRTLPLTHWDSIPGKPVSVTGSYNDLTDKPEIDAIPIGTVISGIWASAPDGYLLLRGGTIGDGTSGASVFANPLMEDLFLLLWNSFADSEAPVSGGRGVSAADDWSAHKTIQLPDSRQRFILGKATSGTGTTLGGTGGTIDHVHTVDPPNTTSTASPNINNVTLLALGSAATPSHTHDVNISQFNSGTNNPPFLSLNFAIKY